MAEGISAILTYAVGVAISPVPIIAVILMLFSQRARLNGPLFMLGWGASLSVLAGVAYWVAVQGDAATSETASTTIAWGKALFGLILLLLAGRTWRGRPAPGEVAKTPAWMGGIDALAPARALMMGLALAAANPKNLMLSLAAGAAVAQLGLSRQDAVWSLVAFVILGSITIIGPVLYRLVGGESARGRLDALKQWLALHNSAVMTVLFTVFGVVLISQAIPPLT